MIRTILHAVDGSDDSLLELPDEILHKLGWDLYTELEYEVEGEALIVRKALSPYGPIDAD